MVNITRVDESFSTALGPFGLLGLNAGRTLAKEALPPSGCERATSANLSDFALPIEPLDLVGVWEMLATGRAVVVESGCSSERSWLLVEPRIAGSPPGPPSASDLAILARVLRGEAQKVVAHELGYSISTITTACTRGLRAMGIWNRPARAPLLIMLAAHAIAGRVSGAARESRVQLGQRKLRMLESEHPGRATWDTLTPAERNVVTLLLEGQTHREIGTARGTAGRTVANQLAGVYRKLNVSGRGALVAALIETR